MSQSIEMPGARFRLLEGAHRTFSRQRSSEESLGQFMLRNRAPPLILYKQLLPFEDRAARRLSSSVLNSFLLRTRAHPLIFLQAIVAF